MPCNNYYPLDLFGPWTFPPRYFQVPKGKIDTEMF